MTRKTNSRIAGFTFLFYILVAFPSMVLMTRATQAEGVPAKLARVADYASDVRITILLTILSCFSAIVLAVTLYGITREEDHELAVMTMAFRIAEGVLGMIGVPGTLALLWVANAGSTGNALDPADMDTIGSYLLLPAHNTMLGAPFFAVASTIFSYLLLRGRIVPTWLAWIGLIASVLLVVCVPLQIAGYLRGTITSAMWFPMLAFELPVAVWLLVKGAAAPRGRTTAALST